MINNINPVFYPFFANLTPVQQEVYRQILPELEYAPAEIKIQARCTSKDAFAALTAIHNDHPELFWLNGGSSATTYSNIISTLKPKYNSLVNNLSYHKSQFRQAVQSYLQGASGKKPLDVERYIHDRMVRDIDYVHSELDQSAYSALVLHKSVCSGYTRAFQLLMQQSGIPCYFCSGMAIGRNDRVWGGHAWNIVKLASEYYNVDVTWNDCYGTGSDKISYTYYNCTDAAISKNHRRDPEYAFLPRCTSNRYGFEQITGVSPELESVLQDGVTCKTPVKDRATFMDVVTREIRRSDPRQFSISLPSHGSATPKSAMSWFESAIAQVYGNIGYRVQVQSTDYRNGWYKLTLIFQRK